MSRYPVSKGTIMTTESTESAEVSRPPAKAMMLLSILVAGALIVSLVNTVLILRSPNASKLEQLNEDLKTDLASSIALVHKKIDGLRSAELEWQAVLKKGAEKPDAIYKIVIAGDGFLTLTEVTPAPSSEPETSSVERK